MKSRRMDLWLQSFRKVFHWTWGLPEKGSSITYIGSKCQGFQEIRHEFSLWMCTYDFILLHNEVSALSWLEKIISSFIHASWCLWQLQGWAYTMNTLPDPSHHLHVGQPLDQGRSESITQRNSGAGKGTQVSPIEWVDTGGPSPIALETWAHAHTWPMGTLQTETVIDKTSIFFLFHVDSSLEKCWDNILMSNLLS